VYAPRRHRSRAGGVLGGRLKRGWRFLFYGSRRWRRGSVSGGKRIKFLGIFSIGDGHILEEGRDSGVGCRERGLVLRDITVSSFLAFILLLVIVLFQRQSERVQQPVDGIANLLQFSANVFRLIGLQRSGKSVHD